MKRHLGKWLAPSQGFYSAVGPAPDKIPAPPKNPGSGSRPRGWSAEMDRKLERVTEVGPAAYAEEVRDKEPEVTVNDDRKLFLNPETGQLQVAENPMDRYFFENAGWSQVGLDDLSGRRLAAEEES